MKLFDKVEPINTAHTLASGCGYYLYALVARVEPFALISPAGDMLWTCTVEADNFRVIGTATEQEIINIEKRLESTPL